MNGQSESQFATLVDTLLADPDRRQQLADLLREDHPFYDQRGTAATVRMRGWVLLAFARIGLSDAALIFVLEELDTGVDPYLIAAAARALRSYTKPSGALAPFVMRALKNIRYRDEPVSFESYAEYADSSAGTSPVRELLATLAWLGPRAREVLPEIESLRGAQPGALSKKLQPELKRTLKAIGGPSQVAEPATDACCTLPGGLSAVFSWAHNSRRNSEPIESTVFEDHDGATITFKEFFSGRPSVVFFFYTRCENPLKCSLTITKLARVQKLLEARGVANHIQTAAITYDPAFDLPARMRGYGQNRGVRLDASHRMLRAIDGFDALRRHFKLGVNFIGSLVNRHRIEVYLLDAAGRITFSFERLHWDEKQVVEHAVELLKAENSESSDVSPRTNRNSARLQKALPLFGTLASVGIAFFPKCPLCWGAYLSVFGIAGLERIPYAPGLPVAFAAVLLTNLVSLWFRGHSTGRMSGFWLAGAGALVMGIAKLQPTVANIAVWGVALTLAGSLLGALRLNRRLVAQEQAFNEARR
jgi:protein SCO1